MTTPALILAGTVALFVIYVAYRIGKLLMRVFLGLVVLALVSWGLWSLFHP